MTVSRRPALDRPWRRPGAAAYALARIRAVAAPPVTVFDPEPGTVVADRDVAVTVRDGTVLRVNVYRPPAGGPCPVLLSAHPYGKDNLPRRRGRRSRLPVQYRLMNQTAPVAHSTLTSWEAPDPAWWVAQGYAVVNADLRGAGTSDGVGSLLSDLEGQDVYDLVEWAAAQPWSTGSVGMLGVSYLAISQYKAAALAPPHLKAICPWEGFTDAYRDLMTPGGVQEDGFASIWTNRVKRSVRLSVDLAAGRAAHPQRDGWWQALVPDLAKITVPMLVCTSFSDNNCHTRGSFRAFEQAGSAERHAYTHRAGKWATFYGDEARATQLAFFDRHLRGAESAPLPRVRLEVRESRDRVVAVRDEEGWPLPRTRWRPLHLAADGALTEAEPQSAGSISFHTRRRAAAFTYTTDEDLELTGPMAVRLWVEVGGGTDVHLFVGVEKWRGTRWFGFEGAYGYGRDRVATGWQAVSLRELDSSASTEAEPVHTFTHPQPLTPGEIVAVDVALGPSATLFRAGDSIRLVVAGRWLAPRNPLTGQFPARYRGSPAATCTLHWGPQRPARLLVPDVPAGGPDPLCLQSRHDRPDRAGGR
ncbi:MAG TPA: CocE/NonD family hydrolase [Mycobacteriales bacterium]